MRARKCSEARRHPNREPRTKYNRTRYQAPTRKDSCLKDETATLRGKPVTRSHRQASSRSSRLTANHTRAAAWRRYLRQKVPTSTASTLTSNRSSRRVKKVIISKHNPWFRPSTRCSRRTQGRTRSALIIPRSSCTRRFIKPCLPQRCPHTMIVRSKEVTWLSSKRYKRPRNFCLPWNKLPERRELRKPWPSRRINMARAWFCPRRLPKSCARTSVM